MYIIYSCSGRIWQVFAAHRHRILNFCFNSFTDTAIVKFESGFLFSTREKYDLENIDATLYTLNWKDLYAFCKEDGGMCTDLFGWVFIIWLNHFL